MSLHSSLVKNKKFNGAIEPALLKHSQEYNVLGILRYLYPQKYNTMVLGEAPDLQDKEHSTGIEVTVAVSENDMKASRAFSQLLEKNDETRKRYMNKIEESGYKLTSIEGNAVSIHTTGTSNGEKTLFQKAIRKKFEKSSNYRKNFKNLGLAVVFTENPTSEAERSCIAWTREVFQNAQESFDFVYILAHRFCFYYDTHTDSCEKRIISRNDSYAIKTIARMTAEGELSLESDEWL